MTAKHSRRGPYRSNALAVLASYHACNEDDPRPVQADHLVWHMTNPLPHKMKAKRRAANRVARMSRRANRPR